MTKILEKVKSSRPYLDYIIFGLILCLVPLFIDLGVFRSAWLLTIGTFIAYAIACLGKNILMGYGGLASLGTAGFIGVGAYMTAILTVDLGWSFFPVFITVIVFTTLLGIVVGLLSLRVEGFFLAIATLVVAEIFRQIFIQVPIFNGFAGRNMQIDGVGPNRFPRLLSERANESITESGGFLYDSFLHNFLTLNQTYFMLVIFLVLAMILTYRIFKSPTGRAMSAMSGSQSAAAAMGVNIFKYRLYTFAISTAFAGASGSLFMFFMRFTNPWDWTLILSLFVFAAVVIGGMRSVSGTILGAAIVWLVPPLILENIPVIGDVSGLSLVFTGIVIIVVVIFSPSGLIYLWWKFWYWLKPKFSRKKEVA